MNSEQLEHALRFIVSENNILISEAFEKIATGFITFVGLQTNQEVRTAIGIMECLEEREIPLLEELQQEPIQAILPQNRASGIESPLSFNTLQLPSSQIRNIQ